MSGPDARVEPFDGRAFELEVDVLVVGGAACGLTAAIAAAGQGASVLVLERDPSPIGSTGMSSGLIPAPATREQRARGIEDDSPERFAADILAKTKGRTDADMVRHIAEQSTVTMDWLTGGLNLPLTLVQASSWPGHSRNRLHGTPKRSGAELVALLLGAAEQAGVDVVTEALVDTLHVDAAGRVHGVGFARPDGSRETVGCGALVLASCGFAGSPELVARYVPEIAGAPAHTHSGDQGHALLWGQALGARTADLAAYQGHASLAYGHGLLISWQAIMEGGVQVNAQGRRFSNEARGYSEQAADVNAQPGRFAWNIYDARIHQALMEFEEYRDALEAGAVRSAADLPSLASATALPLDALSATLADAGRLAVGFGRDGFGRDFTRRPALQPPYYAAKVVGALFHTQGGLAVDREARVLKADGSPLPNLYAGGGAARGVSGPGADGYMSGNGLLTATTLGRLAGVAAARQARVGQPETAAG